MSRNVKQIQLRQNQDGYIEFSVGLTMASGTLLADVQRGHEETKRTAKMHFPKRH